MSSRRRPLRILLVLVLGLLISAIGLGGASGQPITLPHLVSDQPAAWTPQVIGNVRSFAAVGSQMYAGGVFTTVKSAGGKHTYPRRNFFAFNASTGAVSPVAPAFNGIVLSVLPDPTNPRYLFIGGDFTRAGGLARAHIAKYDIQNSRIDPTFATGTDGEVSDLHFARGHLLIAGTFTRVGRTARTALASVSPATGAADSFVDDVITGRQPNTSTTRVYHFAVRPQQDYLVAIGNFTAVNGQARRWAFMLYLGTHSALTPWNSQRYLMHAYCSPEFPQALRDVDFAPTGGYFALASTGGAHYQTICDAASGWYFQPANSDQAPAWVQYTGGDTLTSVAVAGNGIYYVGGHNRWLDNAPQPGVCGYNTACPGAFTANGLGALDAYGRAIRSWYAPRSPRGVGAQELYVSRSGLWMGGDQVRVGGQTRPGMAFFPLG